MKKVLALFLSTYMLVAAALGNGDLHELAKIPALIHHYQEHQERSGYKQLSFGEFLQMHYADPNHEQSENHEELPLKHSHSCNLQVVSLSHPEISMETFQQWVEMLRPIYHPSFISSFLVSIWQPPQ